MSKYPGVEIVSYDKMNVQNSNGDKISFDRWELEVIQRSLNIGLSWTPEQVEETLEFGRKHRAECEARRNALA